jgi:hypothetical protein
MTSYYTLRKELDQIFYLRDVFIPEICGFNASVLGFIQSDDYGLICDSTKPFMDVSNPQISGMNKSHHYDLLRSTLSLALTKIE